MRSSSTAATVPFDVLLEIFYHCLPDSPLNEVQPNSKIAPMLLCHVCSSWRRTALESPRLWKYLYYRLPLRWDNNPRSILIVWDLDVFENNIECLKWWLKNLGFGKAPFIRLECYQPKEEINTESQECELSSKYLREFFRDYLSRAGYLDVPDFVSYLPQMTPLHYSNVPFEYYGLHSLATSFPKNDQSAKWSPRTASEFHLKSFYPFYIGQNLRRLRLHHVELMDYTNAFVHWSRLTHISLHNMYMTPAVWFSLIRGMPNLQWGYLEILLHSTSNINPPKFTLPYLDTLSVTLDNSEINEGDPFSQLLTNLHLPALRDLSIYIDADHWGFPVAALKINDGLKSAPAVSKLTIGFQFLGFSEFVDPDTTTWDEVDTLPTLVPQLAHLVLDMCYMHADFEYEATLSRRLGYLVQFLRPTRWLDLASPASTLRKISVVVKEPSRDGPLVEGDIRDALELPEAGHDEETKIMLEIIPEDKRGLAPYAEGYKTWGCSL